MVLPALALLIGSLYLFLYLYMKSWYNYWKRKNIPIKKPEYFIGNIIRVLLKKYSSPKYIASLCPEFKSPYFVFFSVCKPFLVVKDPDIIKRILVTDFQKFSDKIFVSNKDLDPVFCNSILTSQNPHWKNVRSKLTKTFSPAKIKAMFKIGKNCGEKLKLYLDGYLGQVVNIQDVTMRYSTEVVSNCAFGIESDCFSPELNTFTIKAHNIFPKSYIGTVKGFTYVFLPQLVKIFKYRFLDKKSCDFFKDVFMQLIKQRENLNIKRNDLIGILMDLKQKDVEGTLFDQNSVLAQATCFMAIGHETLTSLLALTVHQLALNPEIQSRLRSEINEVIERYGDITPDALDSMKYLEMVIYETLRMFPVIQFIQRQSTEDCFLPETGITLEKGTSIIIPTYWLHYNETHFPEPNKYNPDRFKEENNNIINPFAFLPFSAGPRACVGKRFALLNMKIGLVYFIRNFLIEMDGNKNLVFGSSHSLETKNGIFVKLTKV